MKISSESIASVLCYYGFSRSVAGEEEFARAVDAVQKMFLTGRGLLLSGAAGCGKTRLMTAIMKSFRRGGEMFFYCKEPNDMRYLRGECDSVLDSNVYIDDMGSEEIVREFGNTVDVIGDFVQRYHYRGRKRLFVTTNLTSGQINERYGGRVLDRLLEMCVVFKMSGRSKRERVVV